MADGTSEVSSIKLGESIQQALLEALSHVPSSTCAAVVNPQDEAERIAFRAKAAAAAAAFGLSLPPGPLGLLTIIPDLLVIWKIQSQMVADIAALYGKSATLRREAMVYCLFKHGVASLGRDLLVRVGRRVVLRRASIAVMKKALGQIGVKVSARVVGKGLSRWIPIVGGGVVAAYAWYDTGQVADTAIALFSKPIEVGSSRATTFAKSAKPAKAAKKSAASSPRSTHGSSRLRQGKGRAVRPQPGTGRPRQRQ